MNTLAERVKERMAVMGLNNAKLALAAGVKPPTSYNWGSGKTLKIKGDPLLLAAAALGVTPEWLNSGKGKKYPDEATTAAHHVAESVVPYRRSTDCDEWTTEAIKLMQSLRPDQREGALAALRTHIQNLGPPRHGQTLSVAA